MAGLLVLVQVIGVRIPAPQLTLQSDLYVPWDVQLRDERAQAATASASTASSGVASSPFCARAARSARIRTMQGKTASAVSPVAHQKAIPYAWAAAPRPVAPLSERSRTTASTAVPIDPPTRCRT